MINFYNQYCGIQNHDEVDISTVMHFFIYSFIRYVLQTTKFGLIAQCFDCFVIVNNNC